MRRLGDAVSAFRSGKGLKGQLLRGGVGSLAVKLGSTLLNVLLAVVLARTLGAEGFGIYSFVFALITILAIPAQMGLPNLVVRETAKAQANGDWALMKGLWRWSTLMALAMSLALMAIGALAAWLFASRLPDGGLAVFYWGLVLVPLVALGNLRGAALRGLRHVVQGQLPEFILRPAFLILLVLGAHFGLSAQALTASDAMMLHALASLVAFVIGAWLLMRGMPGELHNSAANIKRSLWLSAMLPLGLIQAAHLLNDNFSLILVGILHPPEQVSSLRIAIQVATFVTFAIIAIETAIAPHIARLFTQKDNARIQLLITRSAQTGFASALGVAVILVVAGREIIELLFGASYAQSYVPIIVLAVARLIAAVMGPSGMFLQMARDENYILQILWIVTAINLALLPAAVFLGGAIGAAISAGATLIAWNFLLYRRARKKFGIDCIGINFGR